MIPIKGFVKARGKSVADQLDSKSAGKTTCLESSSRSCARKVMKSNRCTRCGRKGLDNGRLYQFAREKFELCFTRDAGFANTVRQGPKQPGFKPLHVTLVQKPQDLFVADFLKAFAATNWNSVQHGADWP